MSGIAEIRFDATPDMPNLTELKGYTVNIFDQYTANINNVEGVNCELAVSNIKENGNNLAYLSNSFKVRGNNGSPADFKIDGAEIGDTFTLTATAAGTNVSVSKDITVNADAAAFISSSKDKKIDDTDLRKKLGYDR